MAKKTTVKSTSKKKTVAKKKKTTGKGMSTMDKTMNAGAKQGVNKTPAARTATMEKKTTVKQKNPSSKDLLMKKFDRWQPERLYIVPKAADDAADFSAPPRIDDGDSRMREILTRKFDFDFAAVSKPPKPKRTVAELLRLRFDRWQPERLYIVPKAADDAADFSAPPRIDDGDSRMREILTRKFDFDFAELAEKAEAARKAAEEKAAAEKAEAARKAAEEKAAAEKAEAARKAAEEKAAAEKAEAARKAAEEKAAAEKAEAERKAAEEKAAAEKAEAERKAAEEKAAAEKAEAERKAAEEKAKAKKKADPVEKAVRYTVACLAVVFTLIVAASFSNHSRYYLRSEGDALAVWKGRFSPVGTVRIAELSGMFMPSAVKDVYTRTEALTLILDHYISKVDALFAEETPNLEQIQSYLTEAQAFAFNDEYREAVDTRLISVTLIGTLFRADAAAAKGGPADLQKALEILQEAAALDLTEQQALIVEKRIEAVKGILEGAQVINGAAPRTAAPEPGAAAPEQHHSDRASEDGKPEMTI